MFHAPILRPVVFFLGEAKLFLYFNHDTRVLLTQFREFYCGVSAQIVVERQRRFLTDFRRRLKPI